MATNPPGSAGARDDRRRRFVFLLLGLILALLIAFGGAFLAVVSQNPGAQPTGAATSYGTPIPSP